MSRPHAECLSFHLSLFLWPSFSEWLYISGENMETFSDTRAAYIPLRLICEFSAPFQMGLSILDLYKGARDRSGSWSAYILTIFFSKPRVLLFHSISTWPRFEITRIFQLAIWANVSKAFSDCFTKFNKVNRYKKKRVEKKWSRGFQSAYRISMYLQQIEHWREASTRGIIKKKKQKKNFNEQGKNSGAKRNNSWI